MYISIDIETDGPVASVNSMIALGAVAVEPGLERTFYATIKAITPNFDVEALGVVGFTREQTLAFEEPKIVIPRFFNWLAEITSKPIFVADNPGFDFAFVNWYAFKYYGHNPFGHSSRSIADLFRGLRRNIRADLETLQVTAHDHNALNDAMGNAEVLLAVANQLGIK